ncbi:MAG: lysophospholipid acyltransferase family protein [Acidimicrobiales bacterium]
MSEELRAYVSQVGDSPTSFKVHGLVRRIIRMAFYRYFRVEVVHPERLETAGASIIAPVHRSNLDSPLVAAASRRRFRVLAKKSLFANKPVSWFIAALGAYPVERGTADREAMRVMRGFLERGDSLLVFPEGTRQSGPEVGEIFDGTAFLAVKGKAKVIPVGVAGTEQAMPPGTKFPRRSTVRIVVGEPLIPPGADGERVPRSELRKYTAEIRQSLQSVLDEANELL